MYGTRRATDGDLEVLHDREKDTRRALTTRACDEVALWILVQVATTVTTTYAIGPFTAAIMDERS